MRKAANIISIISFIISLIGGFIILLISQAAVRVVSELLWAWVLWVILIIVRFFILIMRPTMIDNDHKVACGVLTLLFISVLAGIFTFCIPDYRPSINRQPSHYSNPYSSSSQANFEYKVGQKVRLKDSGWEGDIPIEGGTIGTVVHVSSDGSLLTVRFDSYNGDEIKISKYCVEEIKGESIDLKPKPLSCARSELTELKQLYEDGLISEKEYELKKKQILGL